MRIVALRHLWWGICITGKHYTGEIIRYPDPTVELIRKLSRKEAKQLAEQDESPFWETETNRFNSLEQLERFAIKWCEANLGDEWLLVENDWNNPNRAIAGKGYIEPLIPGLTALAKWWWALPEKQREPIWKEFYDVWNNLLKKS